MTFDETAMLNPRPHKDHDNKVEVHGDIKKVEFEVEAREPEEIYDESEVTPNRETHQSYNKLATEHQLVHQTHSIRD